MFSYEFSFHPLSDSSGPAQAFAELIVDGCLKVSGFKIMKNQKSGELWVAPPQEKSNKLDDEGKPQYFPRVWWVDSKEKEEDRRTKMEEEVYSAMVQAWEASRKVSSRQAAAGAHATRNSPQTPEAKPRGKTPLWGG